MTTPRAVVGSLPLFGAALFGYWLVNSVFVTTIFLLPALVTAVSYRGVDVDVEQRRYRNFTWVLGIHVGAWQLLPVATRVVLKPHSDSIVYASSRRSSTYNTRRYEHFTLLLSLPDAIIGEVIEEFTLDQHFHAVSAGEQLAELLQIPFINLVEV